MKKKNVRPKFKMLASNFAYSKTYYSAWKFVRGMFMKPDLMTDIQKEDIIEHYDINRSQLNEIIARCLNCKEHRSNRKI